MIWRLVAVLGAAAMLFAAGLVAAPSSAQAYIGESFVTEVVGGHPELTEQAKSLLTNPTFLTEEPAEAAGALGSTEGGSAIIAGEATGLLPDLALISPYVAGATVAAIGTATVCDALFDGCFGIFGASSDPPVVPETETFEISTTPGGRVYGYWFPYGTKYRIVAGAYPAFREGISESCAAHGGFSYPGWPVRPAGRGVHVTVPPFGGILCDDGNAAPLTVEEASVVGDGTNRRISNEGTLSSPTVTDPQYCQVGASGCTSSPPSNWSRKYAECLASAPADCGLTREQADRLGQRIAAGVPGSGVADPYSSSSTVPTQCKVGAKAAPCIAALKELEVVPKVKELDWEEAVVEELEILDPEKTREEESERIIELPNPLPNEVTKGSDFPITVNPPTEDMPEFVPEPGEDETAEEYKERKLPWLPLPLWHADELSDATLDPSKGPEEISRLTPKPGTRIDPHGETHIDAKVNPKDAPVPGGGSVGQGTCSATVPAIDWSPLNQPLGKRFPFGVFGFFVGWFREWELGETHPPDWTVTIIPAGVFGSPDGLHAHINFGFLQPVVSVARVVFLFAAFVGLLWFLATAAAKLQGDSS